VVSQSLAQRCTDCRSEKRNGLDDAPHVSGSLAERILQKRNRSQNLRHCDQDVAACLPPDIDGRLLRARFACGIVATGTELIYFGLYDGRPNHGQTCRRKSGSYALDGRKVDAGST